MTARTTSDRFTRPVSPVLQFVLLIVPVVMNGFFLVYALTGWVIEGRSLSNWSLEAPVVAVRVGFTIAALAFALLLWTRWRRLPWRHPLVVSTLVHGVLAMVLAFVTLAAAQR